MTRSEPDDTLALRLARGFFYAGIVLLAASLVVFCVMWAVPKWDLHDAASAGNMVALAGFACILLVIMLAGLWRRLFTTVCVVLLFGFPVGAFSAILYVGQWWVGPAAFIVMCCGGSMLGKLDALEV